ncbi:3-oxoacyl-ACP reductase [Chromatium okenii]|uniref:SDR family oxidoreductase n=1 Tax=Chromatium okenii TaxID=61644 RepID=UPI001906C372|nr:SDR family NAD(P)-dependent oxidoreductase [Chromatium okenii]MBK1642745.1 3-oxoacyl-ACP reductase [Chromatium okenii]
MFPLNQKIIILTGATGNLGRVTAQVLAAQGARLALVGRNLPKLDDVRQSLTNPGNVAIFVADVRHPEAVTVMMNQVLTRFGRVDGLINLAGGFTMGAAVHNAPDADWDAMLDLNLRTTRNCIRAVVPHLLKAGGGRIVNIAARGAVTGAAYMAPYAVSKAAVVTLTESVAAELNAHDITVNCLLPGTLDTPDNRAAMPQQNPAHWVALEALAEVIAFLVSDAARAITGAAIPVYGRS